jgi:type IV secretion system protein VirB2
MTTSTGNRRRIPGAITHRWLWAALWTDLAAAQSSPFATGATALQSNLLTILAPVAIIAVMVLGVAAWFNRISWSWMIGGVAGIVLVFGSSQVVTWVRGLFGV